LTVAFPAMEKETVEMDCTEIHDGIVGLLTSKQGAA
jgi:hypothetical protein